MKRTDSSEMAVTVGAYRRVGGIPPLPSLEDVALYDALRAVNARIRHSPAVRVVTSATCRRMWWIARP